MNKEKREEIRTWASVATLAVSLIVLWVVSQ